jgi:large subunit ribosomal protein L1
MLRENLATLMEAIVAAKPQDSKGAYIRSATITTTMGPGIPLDVAAVQAMKTA